MARNELLERVRRAGAGAGARAGGLVVALACALSIAASAADASTLHFEIANANGINSFSGYNYICLDCTSQQYAAMVLPPGFAKRNDRILIPASVGGLPDTPPPGVPVSLDLVPDLPGDDFLYCCEVVNGSFLGADIASGVLFNTALVRRSNVFTFAAGEVLHEVIDDLGNHYALFLFDLALSQTFDLSQVGALSGFALPAGWSHASRVLSSPLVMGSDPDGLVRNFGHVAIGVGVLAAWQRYPVPEPATDLLLGSGLWGLAAARRRSGRAQGGR